MHHFLSYPYHHTSHNRGFTLIEILVVIGMIGILAAAVLVAVNPLKQFAQARNAQRISNVEAILNAIGNRLADRQGIFSGEASCPSDIPEGGEETMSSTGGYDIRPCLVPEIHLRAAYRPFYRRKYMFRRAML